MAAATKTREPQLIKLYNPATGVTLEYCGKWLRPGKATMADVKRGWARYPGEKVFLNLPVGVQTQLDAGRLQVATDWEARERIADAQAAGSEDSAEDSAMPSVRASHEAWLQYAVSQGMDRSDAADLTRAQIRARFSVPAFDPEAPPAEIGSEYEVLS